MHKESSPSFSLGDYRWERRPLLVFSPSEDSAQLEEQRRYIKDTLLEFEERRMILIQVTGRDVLLADGRRYPNQAIEIRSDFDVAESESTAILIGLDGGEKSRTSLPAEMEDIYALIDTMPMRRAETSRPRD